MMIIYSIPLEVGTNQQVNKTFKTLAYYLFPVPCPLKSSGIFATNKIGLLYFCAKLLNQSLHVQI